MNSTPLSGDARLSKAGISLKRKLKRTEVGIGISVIVKNQNILFVRSNTFRMGNYHFPDWGYSHV